MEHAFAISAYGKSPYLEACIRSLKAQTKESEIIICTSTPCEYIEELAKKYDIRLYINANGGGIGRDWNYAYSCTSSQLVTIAHQDDIYEKHYTERLLAAKNRYPDMSLFTSAYCTVKDGKLMPAGKMEAIKMLLRLPLRFRNISHLSIVKRLSISLGNPLICPSCTYDRRLCGEHIFDESLKFVLDWELLFKLAHLEGRWICDEMPLLLYRVHDASATKACISDSSREREERAMFAKLLPPVFADMIMKFYRRAYAVYS